MQKRRRRHRRGCERAMGPSSTGEHPRTNSSLTVAPASEDRCRERWPCPELGMRPSSPEGCTGAATAGFVQGRRRPDPQGSAAARSVQGWRRPQAVLFAMRNTGVEDRQISSHLPTPPGSIDDQRRPDRATPTSGRSPARRGRHRPEFIAEQGSSRRQCLNLKLSPCALHGHGGRKGSEGGERRSGMAMLGGRE